MAYWQTTWEKHNPDYKMILWDDTDNRNFIRDNYPWFLEKYDGYDVMIKRADAIRYFYLYHYGGIYVDMDFECIKSFDDIVNMENTYDIIFGRMGDPEKYDHEHNIPNAIMISKPRESFWIFVFYNLLIAPNQYENPEYCTGPVILKNAILMYNEMLRLDIKLDNIQWYNQIVTILSENRKPKSELSRIKILDPEYFYPLNWRDQEHQVSWRHPVTEKNELYDSEKVATIFPKSYAVTYWTHTY